MRDLIRNKVKIHYKNRDGEIVTDENGNKERSYGDMRDLHISISSGNSTSSGEVFGRDIVYDRTLRTSNLNCPLNEYSRLWVDVPTTSAHDYIVVSVIKSINSITYAIKKVDVSGH